jgi:uncharacterized damage-inducible protein DinB
VNNVNIIRDHLLHELGLAADTAKGLVRLINSEQWNYRPRENMRSLLELTHHLVTTPASDLAIMQEKSETEVHKIEGDIKGVTDPEKLCEVMQQSYEAFKSYIQSLDEEEFVNKSTKAFYSDEGKEQVKWLIEVVTHMFHHRAQLFNYLKELGHDVNMFMLY